MTLAPMDPEPEPAEADLHPYLGRGIASPEIDRAFAVLMWRADVLAKDKNAFHMPLSPDKPLYDAYLKSDTWKRIRKDVIKSAGKKCTACGSQARQVHHRDYRPRVMSGGDFRPLVALCAACHRRVHYQGSEKRASWVEEEAELAALIEAGARNHD